MERTRKRRTGALLVALAAVLILSSCSSSTAPAQPKMGTPPFYWAAAKEAFAAGDYMKASDNLERLVTGDNEFKTRATAWLSVLYAGMAKGYVDIVPFFEDGSKANRQDPGFFRRYINLNRTAAGRATLRFAEFHESIEKSPEAEVVLAFGFPSGSPNFPPDVKKLSTGMKLPESEIEAMQKRGLVVHEVTPAVEAAWRESAKQGYPMICEKGIVPPDLFDEVQKLLAERRAQEAK